MRAHAPIDLLRNGTVARALSSSRWVRLAIYGGRAFGPWPTVEQVGQPADAQIGLPPVINSSNRSSWRLPPGAPFDHMADFHDALSARGVPHAYNASLYPPSQDALHRWRAEWMEPALQFFEWPAE